MLALGQTMAEQHNRLRHIREISGELKSVLPFTLPP